MQKDNPELISLVSNQMNPGNAARHWFCGW